jgi:enoyl-CoA hydratase/carnithine racemase
MVSFVDVSTEAGIATVRLSRGKVNALNDEVVAQLQSGFQKVESDPAVGAVILTGTGKFFSFGFDTPQFLTYSKSDFERYLRSFSALCLYLFTFPKPIIAAVNGHAIAGGCMLATACESRLMVTGKARIALNEITFGASVFDWSVAMLRCCVGHRNAERILYSGQMYSAEEALELRLVDRCCSVEALPAVALGVAEEFARKDSQAFRYMKKLLRGPVAEEIRRHGEKSISEFLEVWYSEETWRKLEAIKIYS